MAYRLGVDVGGTFTDLFLVSEGDGGAQFRVKTPSTPGDPSEGVLTGVRRICDEAGIGVGELQNFLHGTTVATNAVLESKGARVGLITTRGFGQILHLARSQTPGPLAGWIIMVKPDPPASLADTREAVERLDARGNVVVPVDEAQVEEIVRDLVDSGIESLTIALINSYVNPEHEEQIGAIVERLYPGFPVTLELARAARVPRVRAGAHRVHELVRPAEGRRLRRAPPVRAPVDRREGGRQHPALGRRADDDARGGAEPDLRRPLGAVRRCRGRAVRRPQGGLRRHPHVRHGRDVDRRRALPERPAVDRARDGDLALPHPRAVGRRPHGRRGRRLDRPRARADEGAARRPRVGGRRSRPGRVRPGRRAADRDRRERRARPPAAAAARRRDVARRRGVAQRQCRRSPTRWASRPSRRPPRGSSRSSTRTWRARCASSRSSAATTRATSRSSPTAAPGRSTRTPSPS